MAGMQLPTLLGSKIEEQGAAEKAEDVTGA